MAPAASWNGVDIEPSRTILPVAGSSEETPAVELPVASSPPARSTCVPSATATSRSTGAGSRYEAGANDEPVSRCGESLG
jgi:hypothetical protein